MALAETAPPALSVTSIWAPKCPWLELAVLLMDVTSLEQLPERVTGLEPVRLLLVH